MAFIVIIITDVFLAILVNLVLKKDSVLKENVLVKKIDKVIVFVRKDL